MANFLSIVAMIFLMVFTQAHSQYYRRIRKHGNSQTTETSRIIDSSNNFGFGLWKQLPSNVNIFISPISISMLMGLVYLGSRNQTADEIRDLMKYSRGVHEGYKSILTTLKPNEARKSNEIERYQLEMANAMLVEKTFNLVQSYKEQCRKYYDAAVEAVSFSLHPEAAVDSVNGWVAWRTKNKITHVLQEPLDSLTKLFLMNAVYFKGTWQTKFDQRLTMPDTFYNDGRVPKTVPMMRQKKKLRYGFDGRIEGHALELPYSGNDVTMLILLPEKRDGLQQLESSLTDDLIGDISAGLREVMVQVTLPRFNLMEDYNLLPLLKEMGVVRMFDPDLANLSGISTKAGLYVTKMIHKCSVEVNEEGTEAAAISGVAAGVRTGGPLVPLFTADHPFIFFIRDNRLNLTLFMGRVINL